MAAVSSPGATNRQTWVAAATALVVPVILAIGMFFTLQANQNNLETRLALDEERIEARHQRIEARLDRYDDQQRSDSQKQAQSSADSGERLVRIETRLDSIESYIVAISDRLEVTMRSQGQ